MLHKDLEKALQFLIRLPRYLCHPVSIVQQVLNGLVRDQRWLRYHSQSGRGCNRQGKPERVAPGCSPRFQLIPKPLGPTRIGLKRRQRQIGALSGPNIGQGHKPRRSRPVSPSLKHAPLEREVSLVVVCRLQPENIEPCCTVNHKDVLRLMCQFEGTCFERAVGISRKRRF